MTVHCIHIQYTQRKEYNFVPFILYCKLHLHNNIYLEAVECLLKNFTH